MARSVRVLVYGDVDLNLIDGSAVWLQSVVSALQRVERVSLTVQLKRRIERDVLVAPLRALERVELVDPPADAGIRLKPERVPDLLAEHDRRLGGVDAILLRGFEVCRRVAADPRLAGRLWCYVTDFPQSLDDLTDEKAEELTAIARSSRVVLCQTPEMRSFLEHAVPALRGRTALLPPLVPDMPDAPPEGLGRRRAERIVYTGKFCKLWRTEELVAAMPPLRAAIPGADLVVAGDKIHIEAGDPGYQDRMRTALETTPGVDWRGAMSREAVQELIATADFGVSVRDPGLDASLELSTKVLEYGRAGVPPVLSRTPMHERVLGADYPLFVGADDDLAARLQEVMEAPELYERAARAAWAAARAHTFEAVSRRFAALLDRLAPEPVVEVREPRHVLVVGHDLKFTSHIVAHLRALPDVEVRVQRWVDRHDEAESLRNRDWADAVLAEWCLANAVWFGSHRRPGQRVVSRFHLVERETVHPAKLRPEWMDHIAFVGPHILEEVAERLAVPRDRLSVIPNTVPTSHLERPKLPGSAFNLGIVGITPLRKRLDLALDTLRLLREQDDRFTLFVKGHLPLEYRWVRRDPEERAGFLAIADRIVADPLLAESVVFDPFGDDVAEWYRKIGFILSVSDFESFHLGLAEGIASGCAPVIRDWEGAAAIYPGERLVSTARDAADEILRALDAGELDAREAAAATAWEDRQVIEVCRAWERLLLAPAI